MATQQQPGHHGGSTNGSLLSKTEESLCSLFDAVYSDGDLRVTEQLVADNVSGHCTGTDEAYRGMSELKVHAARLRKSFPGLTIDVKKFYSTPDGFVGELALAGRFERPFGGVHPSCRMKGVGDEPGGPVVTIPGRVEGRVTDAEITELTFDWDFEVLRSQS